MVAAPWSQTLGLEAVVDAWLASGKIRPCLAADRTVARTAPKYGPIPDSLPQNLRTALKERGISRFYAHQSQAIDAALANRHVLVATPTASGKSLCFNAPVLSRLAAEPTARALYLYPTKALSRDQEHSLQALVHEAQIPAGAIVVDGDTPGDARRTAREQGRVLLTNPDMLHASILPNHARWATLFQELRYVVIDELHMYRGVFGSHFAHVIARLKRLAQFHGSNPTFLCATATIGNPLDHAARLLGVEEHEIELVDETGAPQAERQVFLYNPPVVNEELGIRGSSLKHAVSLAAELIRARVPTLVFGPSRNSVETMLKYLRAECGDVAGNDAIQAYRGGYLPETRRAVEAGLRDGKVLGVVATNALELGIDIGDLDAVICVGYPGSVAATWQRFGRAGRRGSKSIAVMVCSSSPIDQYIAREPSALLDAPIEEARIDAGNVEVVIQHLKCAAFEAPFEMTPAGPRPADPSPAHGEAYLGLDQASTREALEYLAQHGLVHEAGGRFHWCGEPFPAHQVSLRNIGWDNFVIIDVETNDSLAEMDWRSAHTMLHEQAIYQHNAEQFQVERLDYDNHKAFVRHVEPDYFTTAMTERSVVVLDERLTRPESPTSPARFGFGDVKVIEKVTGYKKIKFFTHENAGYGDVYLPEIEMHTVSFWLTIPERVIESLDLPRAAIVDGLRGFGAALETIATLALMCEPRDINRTLGDGAAPDTGLSAGREPGPRDVRRIGGLDPTLFLFDATPGGVGLTERVYDRIDELAARTLALISGCPCLFGCPSCVGPTESDAPGELQRKSTAVRVGRALFTHSPSL